MNKINHEIMKLWDSTAKDCLNGLMPAYISDLVPDSLLFIGINPSFSKRGFTAVLKGIKESDLDIYEFFKYPNSTPNYWEKVKKIEKSSGEVHRYFDKFIVVSEEVGIKWQHLDLFFIRETKQKELSKFIFEKGETLNIFGEKQISISKKIIEQANPKVIVVANALASRIFKKAFNAKFDSVHGCYFAQVNGRSTPVFLTSMLTGQRALDNFTFERLCWHIKKVSSQ